MAHNNQYTILSSEEMKVFNNIRQINMKKSYKLFYIYIKMFMDVTTFIAGIDRRFCASDFDQEFGFSRFQVYRIIQGLERTGLINHKGNYVFEFILAKQHSQVQKQTAHKPHINRTSNSSRPHQENDETALEYFNKHLNNKGLNEELEITRNRNLSRPHQENDEMIARCARDRNISEYKNKKEDNKDINNIYIVEKSKKPKKDKKNLSGEMLEKFNQFWSLYPRKESPGKVKEIFSKLIENNPELFEKIISALKTQLPMLLKKEVKFRKLPATWLNQECWEDELEEDRKDVGYQNSSIKTRNQQLNENVDKSLDIDLGNWREKYDTSRTK